MAPFSYNDVHEKQYSCIHPNKRDRQVKVLKKSFHVEFHVKLKKSGVVFEVVKKLRRVLSFLIFNYRHTTICICARDSFNISVKMMSDAHQLKCGAH